jgi:hypothetical protein
MYPYFTNKEKEVVSILLDIHSSLKKRKTLSLRKPTISKNKLNIRKNILNNFTIKVIWVNTFE